LFFALPKGRQQWPRPERNAEACVFFQYRRFESLAFHRKRGVRPASRADWGLEGRRFIVKSRYRFVSIHSMAMQKQRVLAVCRFVNTSDGFFHKIKFYNNSLNTEK
jgi:hypothetical protein